MHTVQELIQDVAKSRRSFLEGIANLSPLQAQYKPDAEVWSVAEITEHLFWAEQNGIIGMWKTLHALREGVIEPQHESVHQNMTIEEIIALTWRSREIVPAMAAPRVGGPLSFWSNSLSSLQEVLDAFGRELRDDELRIQTQPHPISGPMDFHQRLEFLAFHINRHREQASIRLMQVK